MGVTRNNLSKRDMTSVTLTMRNLRKSRVQLSVVVVWIRRHIIDDRIGVGQHTGNKDAGQSPVSMCVKTVVDVNAFRTSGAEHI